MESNMIEKVYQMLDTIPVTPENADLIDEIRKDVSQENLTAALEKINRLSSLRNQNENEQMIREIKEEKSKKDFGLIIGLIALYAIYLIWEFVGFKTILAKITLMYFSPVQRTHVVLGIIGTLLSIIMIQKVEGKNKISKVQGIVISSIVVVLSYVLIKQSSYNEFFTTIKYEILLPIVFLITYFLIRGNVKAWSYTMCVVAVISGAIVNPIVRGIAPINKTDISKEIKQILDDYVIGQDEAKKTLSVAVYNHYKRIANEEEMMAKHEKNDDDVEIQKSNILLLGPTGCGKTLLASTLAKILNVPFAIADATTLTEAGYVGEDVENILLKLIQAADGDIEKAEKGIIYIDEIDKITRKSENPSITRDVSGEGVQQALLKIVEGTVASVPPQGGRKHPQQELLQINTSNILFICGGAFEGLENIIKDRIGKKSMGFGADIESKKDIDKYKVFEQLLPQDLLKFGMIPEFIGRLPIIATLKELDREALIKITTEPKNALVKQYKKLLQMDDVELIFEHEALEAIVDKAIERKTGARGLRSIIEEIMRDIMFDIPSNEKIEQCIVTKETVLDNQEPRIIENPNKVKKTRSERIAVEQKETA